MIFENSLLTVLVVSVIVKLFVILIFSSLYFVSKVYISFLNKFFVYSTVTWSHWLFCNVLINCYRFSNYLLFMAGVIFFGVFLLIICLSFFSGTYFVIGALTIEWSIAEANLLYFSFCRKWCSVETDFFQSAKSNFPCIWFQAQFSFEAHIRLQCVVFCDCFIYFFISNFYYFVVLYFDDFQAVMRG